MSIPRSAKRSSEASPALCLTEPTIAKVDECHLIDGPLGRRFFRRKPDYILHPARQSAESLADIFFGCASSSRSRSM